MIDFEKAKTIPGLKLPKFSQMGIAVRNIDQAMERFSTIFGVRTFYRRRLNGADYEAFHRGKKAPMDLDVAFFYSGSIQIALLEASTNEDNPFTEHLAEYGEGLHHFTYLVKGIDKYLKTANDLGIETVQTGFVKDGASTTRFAVLDTREILGIMIEIHEMKFLGIHIGLSKTMMRLAWLTGAVTRKKFPK